MLTKKQKQVFEFIQHFMQTHGYAPSGQEIADGIGISSRGVAHRYVSALVDAGKLRIVPGRRRNIEIIQEASNEMVIPPLELPVLGSIAAGSPIEAVNVDKTLNIAEKMLGPNRFVLQVKGDSMLGDNICDGDFIVAEKTYNIRKNDIVIAVIDGQEATLKRYRRNEDHSITLIPSNPSYTPMVYIEDRISIQGVFLGLLRFLT